jgi:hypothetical protein
LDAAAVSNGNLELKKVQNHIARFKIFMEQSVFWRIGITVIKLVTEND